MAELFEHVDRSFRGTLADWVESEADPVAGVERCLHGVLFAVVDANAVGIGPEMLQNFERPFRAANFILQMRRMDENHLVIVDGHLNLLFEDRFFVGRRLVKADLTDAEHVRFVEELRHFRQHLSRECWVLSFLWIDGHPREVLNSVEGCSGWFGRRQLVEVVDERFGVLAIKTGPKRGLGDGDDARHGHALIVPRRTGHGVIVWLDELHGEVPIRRGR